MVNFENHPVYMDYVDRKDFVLKAREAGHFEHLSDRWKTILELRYFGDQRTSHKAIGEQLIPPRSAERVRQIDVSALSKLHRLNTGLRHPDGIGSLELSERVYNALIRSQITTLGQIALMPDEELLGLRAFGEKSLHELRKKLASHQLNQPTTNEV